MLKRKLYNHPYSKCTVEELEIIGDSHGYVRGDEEDGDRVSVYCLISYETSVMRIFVNHTRGTVWASCPLTYSQTTRRQLSWFISEMRNLLSKEFPQASEWTYQSFKQRVIGETVQVRII